MPEEGAFGVQRGVDVNPDHLAGQGVVEPACAADDAAPQTAEQLAAAAVPESTEELPAAAQPTASSPTRVEEATGMPPPSNATEEEGRAPTPPPVEGREVPTPPRAGATSTAGSPGLVQGPVCSDAGSDPLALRGIGEPV
ncbi:skin secretory protein xP2-like [Sorghum bicolor]|uniref:skin secretory protein xP2-like n=1 Tax=Sorghum bicolor TaxID=4558 RepID=UPI000B426BD5|nr:skin secretory protein xP2-like [Sorghum bicolor]|eukprot:XP_021307149.1 skin secretory protein xP2-like [Sorghum bicolor]